MRNDKVAFRRARQWWTTESREWEDDNEVANERCLRARDIINEDCGLHLSEVTMLPTQ